MTNSLLSLKFKITEAKTFDLLCLSEREMNILIGALEEQIISKNYFQSGTTSQLLHRLQKELKN